MRVAHLVIGGGIAGGQVVALQLLRALRDAGGDGLIVAPARGAFTELVEAEGFPVRLLAPGRSFRADRAVALARLIRRERADLLHTHTHLAGNVVGRLAAALARIPVVAHMHIENHLRSGRTGRLQAILDNATARLAARIVCVSEDTRRAYERQGYPPDRMEVIHNGIAAAMVPRDGADRVRAELGIPAGTPLIGEIARLCEVKGQRTLLEALARIDDGARAVLVGGDLETDGAYERGLRAHAKALGIAERVVFAGQRRDPHAVLEALDVFCLPSTIEGLPLTVLEAMAHAKPVVATPVGGTPELVRDGETGLLVPPGNPAALAAALERLLGDSELRRQLGGAGYELVEREFSEEVMARRVLAIYGEVVR